MSNTLRNITAIVLAFIFSNCNNSSTDEKPVHDSITTFPDTTITMPVIREGGMQDSIQTGATDTTLKKDSIQ